MRIMRSMGKREFVGDPEGHQQGHEVAQIAPKTIQRPAHHDIDSSSLGILTIRHRRLNSETPTFRPLRPKMHITAIGSTGSADDPQRSGFDPWANYFVVKSESNGTRRS